MILSERDLGKVIFVCECSQRSSRCENTASGTHEVLKWNTVVVVPHSALISSQ